jgi:hypothetical protein
MVRSGWKRDQWGLLVAKWIFLAGVIYVIVRKFCRPLRRSNQTVNNNNQLAIMITKTKKSCRYLVKISKKNLKLWLFLLHIRFILSFKVISSYIKKYPLINLTRSNLMINKSETVTGHFFLPCPALLPCLTSPCPALPGIHEFFFALPCPQGRAGRPQGFYTNWMFTMFIQVCWKTEKSSPCSSGFPIRGGGWFSPPKLETCLPLCKNF